MGEIMVRWPDIGPTRTINKQQQQQQQQQQKQQQEVKTTDRREVAFKNSYVL